MCFFHIYILEKYFKDKFTIQFIFSVQAHRYHANLGKHGCLVAKWSGKMVGKNGRGKVNQSRPTHYDIHVGMSLQ